MLFSTNWYRTMPLRRKAETGGGRLTGLLLLLFLLSVLSRPSLVAMGGPTLVSQRSKYLILLGEGFSRPGVHQFCDASGILGVINMTKTEHARQLLTDSLNRSAPRAGEMFEITGKTSLEQRLWRHWMSASQRIALGIPLHPDRMTERDWTVLSGVGPALAHEIEKNRQKVGEFRNFNGLMRVNGVGEGLVKKNSLFFLPSN